jgi:plastocyanin
VIRAGGVLLAACWLGCVRPSAGAAAATVPVAQTGSARSHRVTIAGFRFQPAELTVTVGDTVVWQNGDALPHTTAADSSAWSSPELSRDGRFVLVATQAGRFPYHCAAHPVMRALLVVRP